MLLLSAAVGMSKGRVRRREELAAVLLYGIIMAIYADVLSGRSSPAHPQLPVLWKS